MLLRRLFCNHRFVKICTIYGDEINARDGKRFILKCVYCGKVKLSDFEEE